MHMNMRSNNIIYAALILTLGSCSKKFVTLYPEGQVNEGVFYKSTSDYQEAVVGAYAPLRTAANSSFYMEEMRADNTFFDYNAKDRGGAQSEELAEFLDGSSNSTIYTIWSADYQGIQSCDVILDHIKTPPADMTDSIRNSIVGQAEALRAHYYLDRKSVV